MMTTFRPSPGATLLLLVVASLTLGLTTTPLLKVTLEAAIPGSELLWSLTRAEAHTDGAGGFTWDLGKVSRRWLILVTIGILVAFRRHVAWADRAREGLTHDPFWSRHLGLGVLAGMFATAVYFGVLYAGGWLVWVPRSAADLIVWFIEYATGAAIVAVAEEVFFRAVMLRTMIRDWGVARGIAVSTTVFAVVHAISGSLRVSDGWDPNIATRLVKTYFTNPEGTVADDLRLMIGLAFLGTLLCLVVIRTGSLWTAIGLHGAMVLASRFGKKILYPDEHYREWLLGDRTIPVAGVVPYVVLTIAILLVLLWRPRQADLQLDPDTISR